MTPTIERLNLLAATWAELAWAVTWQSGLLVGAVLIIARVLRRSSPALRYGLWQITAIKLLLMPLWSVPVALPVSPRVDNGPPPGERPADRAGGGIGGLPSDPFQVPDPGLMLDGPPSPPDRGGPLVSMVDWRGWLLLGWGLAVLGQVAAILAQRRRLNRLLSRTTPADDPALLDLVAGLSGRIGLRRPPEVRVIEGEGSPFVCGLRRPLLVMPAGLAGSLDPESLRSVLLHELAHLRRRDLLWDWIPTFARLLYVVHPAALVIAGRARLERELACDQTAMALSGQDAAGYASALVAVVSRSTTPTALRASLVSAGLDGAGSFPASPTLD